MSVYKPFGKDMSLSPKYISKSGEWKFITSQRKVHQVIELVVTQCVSLDMMTVNLEEEAWS